MKPKIAITMGDPAGVGPEVVVKALNDFRPSENYLPFVIGDPETLSEECRRLSIPATIASYQSVDQIECAAGTIAVLQSEDQLQIPVQYGLVDKKYGDISFNAVVTAVDLAMAKKIDAIVTAPICKESWHLAGHKFDGHTDLLAKLTNSDNYRMMFVSDKLNVILVTIHLSLKEACLGITRRSVKETIEIGASYMQKLGVEKPKLAVCGLNPHAGEGGIFGNEEVQTISPAIEEARRSGISVSGPFPADTVFLKGLQKEYDLIVAQYHDQGLIPVKLVAFDSSVNITIGLPIVRTSVDHGTAFDIAGQGKADYSNILAAISCAVQLSSK